MPLLPTRTDLVYNIVELTLTGTIDGVSISADAGSGGRADFGRFDRLNATA